jgi:hypothetical protein
MHKHEATQVQSSDAFMRARVVLGTVYQIHKYISGLDSFRTLFRT